jgi:hypothetical protein
MDMGSNLFEVSLFTGDDPLSKGYQRTADGGLEKLRGGVMTSGTVETVEIDGPRGFAAFLEGLTPFNAICAGLCGHPKAVITTREKLDTLKLRGRAYPEINGLPLIARLESLFRWRKGGSVLIIDVDDLDLSDQAVLEMIYSVCPALRSAPHVVANSAGSYIYNNGTQLIGQKGRRVYAFIKDGEDTARAGKILYAQTLLKGLGWARPSDAGRPLVRSPIDVSMFQTQKLDFVGGALLVPPLHQKRPSPYVVNPDAEWLDTKSAVQDLTPKEKAELDHVIRALKDGIKAECEEKRAEHAELCARRHMAQSGLDPEKDQELFARLRAQYAAAAETGTLHGDHKVRLASGEEVSVTEILSDKPRFHGVACCDPVEPDYNNNNSVAKIYLYRVGGPIIKSFAHGGINYRLVPNTHSIKYEPGRLIETVDRVLELMRQDGCVFERSDEIVVVDPSGVIRPLDQHALGYEVNRIAAWVKFDKRVNDWKPCEAPDVISRTILSLKGRWGLPKLDAVVTAPFYDAPRRRIVDQEGYDRDTSILYHKKDADTELDVPAYPSREQAQSAVDELMSPFQDFPFDGPVSRGALLSVLISTACRDTLDGAPGYLITASSIAAGKTLIAKCICHIAGDSRPTIMPMPSGAISDDEMRKRLFAAGIMGTKVIVLDNISGKLSSDTMATWLTTNWFTDRILGKSQNAGVSSRCVTICTGNNIQNVKDLNRRFVVSYLAPQAERPWQQRFDMDPEEYCARNRHKLVRAALTLLRYAEITPCEMTGRTSSYETWSDTVRRAVVVVKEQGLASVEDPTVSFDEGMSDDPDTIRLKTLLASWEAIWGGEERAVKQVLAVGMDESVPSEMKDRFMAAVGDIARDKRGMIEPKWLGEFLRRNHKTVADGMRFVKGGITEGARRWRVELLEGVYESPPPLNDESAVLSASIRGSIAQSPYTPPSENPRQQTNRGTRGTRGLLTKEEEESINTAFTRGASAFSRVSGKTGSPLPHSPSAVMDYDL